MLLADLGADVVRIDRKGAARGPRPMSPPAAAAGRPGPQAAGGGRGRLKLMEQADALFEGFRPGVMERLGLGPDVALKRNPRLVYGRMTGWGQSGPLAHAAGHDINYIALDRRAAWHRHARQAGSAAQPGRRFRRRRALSGVRLLAGDHGRRATGKGQVVDCAMTDGAASLMSMFYGMQAAGMWRDSAACNLLDGGAHFYDTYQVQGRKMDRRSAPSSRNSTRAAGEGRDHDPAFEHRWIATLAGAEEKLDVVIKPRRATNGRAIMEGTDVCFAPVLCWMRRRAIRTMSRANLYRPSTGCAARAGAAVLADPGAIQAPPPASARIMRRRWATGALHPRRSRPCSRLARFNQERRYRSPSVQHFQLRLPSPVVVLPRPSGRRLVSGSYPAPSVRRVALQWATRRSSI